MMRVVTAALVACFLMATSAFAADVKIGVVDMQIAGAQSEANVQTKKKYEELFAKESEKLVKAQKDFEEKAKKFEAQRAKLKQADAEKQYADLRKTAQKLSEQEMGLQQNMNALQNAVAQELSDLALKAAADVSKAKNLDLLLAQNVVLFAGPTFDVSKDMLEAMNRLWKADGSKIMASSMADEMFGDKTKK